MRLRLKPLSEQCIVVTGASSGIGLVTARAAARAGARVVAGARNAEALDALVAEIEAAGGQAVAVPTDVGVEADMDRLAQTAIDRFGGFDSWVNNAGVSIFGRTWKVSIADMRRMFETTYWGVVYGSRAAVRHFAGKNSAGAIINVGSFFGDRATPVQSTYASAKFAVHGWTDALRMELEAARIPVSVTLVHPGRIDTPYNEHAQNYMPNAPAHRGMLYTPDAVADAILFACAHPRRDFYVGSQAKIAAVVGNLAPRLSDKIMENYMFWSQRSSRPASTQEPHGLYQPGRGLRERGGTHEGITRGRSLYVQASKHPAVTAAVGIAGLSLLLTATRARPRPRQGRV